MKILIVDDHSLVRKRLQSVLSLSTLSDQYLKARNAASAWRQLGQHLDINFVLLDIQLPDCNGLELLPRIVERHPQLPVVMQDNCQNQPDLPICARRKPVSLHLNVYL